MQTLYPITPPFDKLLGAQAEQGPTRWRPMVYTLPVSVEEGLLLFNTLTRSMVLLEPQEAAALSATGVPSKELLQNWFYVPEGFDDKTLATEVRNIAKELIPVHPPITSYTVFTTTDCNARCFYCYEKGIAKKTMETDTAHEVASYIVRHAGKKQVKIQWFGGEPLYNKEVISLICQDLKDAGISFVSGMISNAYLFDEALVKEAKNEWNLIGTQITLDGTEEVYNKAKAYIYPGVNACRRVLDNIHLLLEAGIFVRIRLNMDLYNADNLIALAKELCQEYKDVRGLCIYSHPIAAEHLSNAALHNAEKRKLLYQKKAQLQQLIDMAGLSDRKPLHRSVQVNQCMADDDSCITILPDGNIGKCEHYGDSGFIGHISKEEFDKDAVLPYKKTRPELEACQTCPFYPTCIRLDKCVWTEVCYPEMQEELMTQTRKSILAEYMALKQKEV